MPAEIRYIYVIQSLFQNDYKSGAELYEDTIKRRIDLLQRESNKMACSFYDAPSKENIIEFLRYIAFNANLMQNGLLIHFEMHGSENKKGLVCSDHRLIDWEELTELFREININCRNNLYISMATCFGRYLDKGSNPDLKSAYRAYISASKEVSVNEVIQNFTELFEVLVEKGDLITAYLQSTNEHSSFFYKDSAEVFMQNIEETKQRMDNDPLFVKEVLGDKIYNLFITDSEETKAILPKLMEQAFKDIFEKQSKAFHFD